MAEACILQCWFALKKKIFSFGKTGKYSEQNIFLDFVERKKMEQNEETKSTILMRFLIGIL